MKRPQLPEGLRGCTILLVPDRAGASTKQVILGAALLRRLRLAGAGGLLLLGILVLATILGWARLWRYDELSDENFALRARLESIDRQLEELDDTLRRIRLYDTQIRHLSRNADMPGFGPLSERDEERWNELWDAPPAGGSAEGEPPPAGDPESAAPGVAVGDIRPAELWAAAVEARVTQLMGEIQDMEPRMSAMVQDLEDWRSYRACFPSIWPAYGVLTSEFGYRRSPFGVRWKFHSGIDVAGPRGTPIFAVAPGVVTFSKYNQGYGRMLEIDHGYGVKTRYAHNTAHFVKEGDVVDVGDKIATIGSTGRTTGPHLHFELIIDGQQVDPADYLP